MEAVVKHVEEEQRPELDRACHLVVAVLVLQRMWCHAIHKNVHVSH